jgi:hypothetical protein
MNTAGEDHFRLAIQMSADETGILRRSYTDS